MSGQPTIHSYQTLTDLVAKLHEDLKEKRFILLYAFNGIGKTRLSMEFKEAGKIGDGRDTLYFNAFTEDLFTWDNDSERKLKINKKSHFFDGLEEVEMENRIRPLLQRYADFDFVINYDEWSINFYHIKQDVSPTERIDHIKVSRGEENIFVWCFFLAVAQLALDKEEGSPYEWVKYIYIDDPISSLDDNNVITFACHLAQLLKKPDNKIKVILSSHHTLFFNVMWNELSQKKKKLQPYFLSKDKATGHYTLRYTGATPFFHHVALLKDLHKAADTGKLYTYHFNMLRSILEKTACFHGFNNFSACIKQDNDDKEGIVHTRMINVLNHGDYSLFEPKEMLDENKQRFKKILYDFMENYRFNPELFSEQTE